MGQALVEQAPETSDSTAAPTTMPLFGGALSASIPPRLADVSLARPVPDHQEVFSDPSLDQALIFEVLERAENVGDGREAMEFFFSDLMEQSDAAEGLSRLDKVDEMKGRGETTPSSLLGLASSPPPPDSGTRIALDACAYAALATGTASIAKGGGQGETSSSSSQPLNKVAVALVLLRFPCVRSDVLISLTSATAIAPGSSSEARAARNVARGGNAEEIEAAAEELLRSVVASFKINDWGLFG